MFHLSSFNFLLSSFFFLLYSFYSLLCTLFSLLSSFFHSIWHSATSDLRKFRRNPNNKTFLKNRLVVLNFNRKKMWSCLNFSLFITFNVFVSTLAVDFNQVVFVILSQSDSHHAKISEETKTILIESLIKENVSNPKVFDLHNDWTVSGGWSIYPLLPSLNELSIDSKWFVFLAENSRVRLDVLNGILSRFSSDYGIFLGHVLNNMDVPYPDFAAGFVLSKELVKLFHTEMVIHSFMYLFAQSYRNNNFKQVKKSVARKDVKN